MEDEEQSVESQEADVQESQEGMSGSGSDSSSASDEDEEDVEMDQEDEALRKKLDTINEQISDQPTSYELLVEKIQILQSMGELKELRKTRGVLSKLYPLTPELWISWIQDESSLVSDLQGKSDIIDLFELAVKDYQSVKIWLEYFQFLREMGAEKIIECRVVGERALAAVGLHVREGIILWDAYRLLELELLASESECTDEQRLRCTSLCFRQLGVPLVGMEKTYESVKDIFEIDEVTERNYKNATEKLKTLETWETKLSEAGNSSAAYKEYIEFEKNDKSNPARIVCLFERAVCDNALDSSLWLEYLNYASNSLQIGSVVLEVAERASRNCPWDFSIWSQWLQEIEKFNSDDEDVKDVVRAVFERGLEYCGTPEQAGSLWLKYIQFLRRRIKFHEPVDADVQLFMKTLITAEEHLTQLSPEPRDYIGEVLLYGIRLQAHITKAMTKSRKLWYQALHKGYGQQFKLWIQFFQLEQRYGEVSSTRKCLEKAMSVMSDGLDVVAELWLNFERDFGDLKTVRHAEEKISEFLGKKYEADMKASMARREKTSNKGKFQKGKGKRARPAAQYSDELDGIKRPKMKKFNNPNGDGGSVDHETKGHGGQGQHYQDGSAPRPKAQRYEKKTQRKPPATFVPRSLQVQSKPSESSAEATATSSNSTNSEFKKPLSNDDFRNLFKKKI